jgi:hypothetical protein
VLFLLPLAAGLGALPAADPDKPAPPEFSEHLIQDGYGYAYGLAAADIDGDGHLDLVSSDATGNALSWYENDGKGNFRRHYIAKDEEGWFERLAVGDINGDGKPDVVVVKNLHGDIVWFENPGKPREDRPWKRHVIIAKDFPGAYDVTLADIDGDGDLDVAASSWVKGNRFAWFENVGSPGKGEKWVMHPIDEKVAETRTIRAAHFKGGGNIDLLGTARTANLVVWYENPGKEVGGMQPWKKHVIDDKSPSPTHGHPVDLDGDGDTDVVMALGFNTAKGTADTHQVVWYENVGKPGDGTVWKKHVIGELEQAFEAVAADLNGDGKLDVVASAWSVPGQLVWFENPGDPKGKWTKHVLKEKWPMANSVVVGDFNGDKRLDIAATAERGSNELRWWRNEGPRKR